MTLLKNIKYDSFSFVGGKFRYFCPRWQNRAFYEEKTSPLASVKNQTVKLIPTAFFAQLFPIFEKLVERKVPQKSRVSTFKKDIAYQNFQNSCFIRVCRYLGFDIFGKMNEPHILNPPVKIIVFLDAFFLFLFWKFVC